MINKIMMKAISLKIVMIELTTQCNLRCVYCSICQPWYKARHMTDECLDTVIASTRRSLNGTAVINGHGETTLLNNWHTIISRLNSKRIKTHLTSNFARIFSDEELTAMVNLHSIGISLDTDDPELLRHTRRFADISVIKTNIRNIQIKARVLKRKPPKLMISCVIHAKNIKHLDRLIALGIELDIDEYHFCNLTKLVGIPEADCIDHVTSLPAKELSEALTIISLARAMAQKNGARFFMPATIPGLINQSIYNKTNSTPHVRNGEAAYSIQPMRRQTRNCIDPWLQTFISVDGLVKPCCYRPPVGSLISDDLDTIRNNEKSIRLRKELLDGNLDEYCRACSGRGLIRRECLMIKVIIFRLKTFLSNLFSACAASFRSPILRVNNSIDLIRSIAFNNRSSVKRASENSRLIKNRKY
jgi:MoaA/NifB/PqqE/SkfB family radical SAM enzyme